MFWKKKRHPYVTFLPEPSDATINILRQVTQQRADISSFEIGLSSLEAPSARLAVELYQLEMYGQKQFMAGVAEIQQPDPRIPHHAVDFVLWTYQGTDPTPALRQPAPDVARRIGELAAIPYDLSQWMRQAQQLSRELGVERIPHVLSTMIHPPPRPAKVTIWNWLHQVQVAAAYVIGCIDSGWEGSVRQRTLISLAYGPMDWTVEAAVLALQQIARSEVSSREDISLVYIELLQSLPRPGGVAYLDAIVWCLQDMIALLSEPFRGDILRRAKAALA